MYVKHMGPVARSLVSANRWFVISGIRTYRFLRYLTRVSANHALSNRPIFFLKKFVFELHLPNFKNFQNVTRSNKLFTK